MDFAFRLLILFGILFLIEFYVFQAVKTAFQDSSTLVKSLGWGFYIFSALLIFGAMVAAFSGLLSGMDRMILTYFGAAVLILFFSKLLIALMFSIDDLRRLGLWTYDLFATTPVDKSRSKFLANLALLLGAIPLTTMTYGIIRNPYRYRIINEKVPINNLPTALKGLKILQISDIHAGTLMYQDPVKRAIELINEQNPDLVFFTGDLVNSSADEMDRYMDIFNKIEAKYGVYSVLGNHDYGHYIRAENKEERDRLRKESADKMIQVHKDLGWDLLMNEHRMLDIDGEKLAVIGVENYSAKRHFPKKGRMDLATPGTENAAVRLLLSHDPTHWDDEVIEKYKNVDITFSGHTHGAQVGVEIPGFLKWSPAKYFYARWAGLYQEGNQYLYVNCGLGCLGYPGRIGVLPEITVLELV